MSVADIERSKQRIAWLDRCFDRMVKAGRADDRTGECETIEGCDECVACGRMGKPGRRTMETGRKIEILRRAVAAFGPVQQTDMMIEEMSELTKAICKLWRTDPGSLDELHAKGSIIEEAADVQIMLDQIKIIVGDTKQVEAKKVARLLSSLDRHEGGQT